MKISALFVIIILLFPSIAICQIEIQDVTTEKNINQSLDSATTIEPAHNINKPTASIVTVENKDFNKGFITSPYELLIGKVAGLSISSLSGKPGTEFTTNIHGNFTLLGNSSPLMIIDGIPQLNWPISLNPNDIESISVLKDGAATDLYSEASNGAITITTKRGTKDVRVEFSSNIALSYVTNQVEVYNGDEFRHLMNQKYAGNTAVLDLLGNANTNWQDEIYQNAISQDHFLSLSGTTKLGTSKFITLPYRISLGKTVQEGVLKTSEFNRNTADITIDPCFFNNHLLFNLNLNGSSSENRIADEQAIENAIIFDPTQPVKIDNGYFEWMGSGNLAGQIIALTNPMALLEFQHKTEIIDHLSTNLKVEYKLHFLPELSIVASYAHNKYTNNRNEISEFVGALQSSNSKNLINLSNTNEYWDVAVRYSKHFEAINSKLSLTIGKSDVKNDEEGTWAFVSNYNSNRRHTETEGSLKTKFGAASITIKERYLANLSCRQEEVREILEDPYWNGAIAWNIKNESFLVKNRTISDLKLRASYGESSRRQVKQQYSSPTTPTILYPDGSGSIIGEIAYPHLKPESIKTFTIGLDYGFLGNRITGTIELYNKKGTDLLILRDQSLSGNNYYINNSVTIETNGIDFSLNANIISNKNWHCSAATNFNYNKTEIISLGSGITAIETGTINAGHGPNIQIQKPGYSPYAFYVYPQQYDNEGKPIEVTSHPKIEPFQKPAPDITMGLSSKLNYKKWEFSFSSRLSLGNYVYNKVSSNSYFDVLGHYDYWRQSVSKLVEKTNFNDQQIFSDYYVEDASFFKMDYMSLGYKFDKLLRNRVGVNLSATLQNAFTITNYSGQDPEVVGGIDYYAYPRPRTYSVKLKIYFQ